MGQLMSIGEVAARTGESRDTIRYYERIGLVPAPVRTPAGYRQYRSGIVNRLGLIRSAQRFGFSLREIRSFLGVRDGGGRPCHDVRAAAGRMLEAMNRQIDELLQARRRMRATLKSWDATLATTPADRPAFLLDSLETRRAAAGTARRAERPAPAPRGGRAGAQQ